jgi:hypothetical protein
MDRLNGAKGFRWAVATMVIFGFIFVAGLSALATRPMPRSPSLPPLPESNPIPGFRESLPMPKPAGPNGDCPSGWILSSKEFCVPTQEALKVTRPEALVEHQTREMVRPAELLKLGEKLLDRGDIAAARLALERAATGGNAQGALKLAMTFDQFFLGEWGTVGTLSDEVKAREWYDRAMTLGATEASQHLDRLPRKPY